MAIKANASTQGSDFKKYVGVASFTVNGVNPTKEELEKFYNREVQNEPSYLTNKVDENDNNKPYKQLRVSFMIEAQPSNLLDEHEKEAIKTNAALDAPLKTTVNFFIDSRYAFNSDKSKVQVIDKFGRTAWVTVEQARNHQIPIYKNGPARIDADYRPAYRGEDILTQFILNYLNVTPIDTWNKNTSEWMTNPNPEDCEGRLERIKDYFNGDISELVEYTKVMPSNRIKLCVGVRTDNDGKQMSTVFSRFSLRNGAKSYTSLKDAIAGNSSSNDTVFTNDSLGNISNIQEYKETVVETDLSKATDDPFASANTELPFGVEEGEDPFA